MVPLFPGDTHIKFPDNTSAVGLGVVDTLTGVLIAVQDAASVAGLVLTTEAAIVDHTDSSPLSPVMAAAGGF